MGTMCVAHTAATLGTLATARAKYLITTKIREEEHFLEDGQGGLQVSSFVASKTKSLDKACTEREPCQPLPTAALGPELTPNRTLLSGATAIAKKAVKKSLKDCFR